MKPSRPVSIVGGGLAGLSLGILLRQQDVPVTLIEAGTYPRHRVCGEFISGRGLAVIESMGLPGRLHVCGAREATTALFASAKTSSGVRSLPRPALCISRHRLDAELARVFCELGGELRLQERWKEGFTEPALVRATGRRLTSNGGQEPRLLGLKAHARDVALEADLEVHLIPNGYVGLCRLTDGMVNVCGLFRCSGSTPDLASRWREWLTGPQGSSLHHRLARATFDNDSFVAVAGLNTHPQTAVSRSECAIGDSLTMIAPVTGNGMSLALESAAVASQELSRYSSGEADWEAARTAIASRCDALFAQRLRWAEWLHAGLLSPRIADCMLRLVPTFPGLWRLLFERTR